MVVPIHLEIMAKEIKVDMLAIAMAVMETIMVEMVMVINKILVILKTFLGHLGLIQGAKAKVDIMLILSKKKMYI